MSKRSIFRLVCCWIGLLVLLSANSGFAPTATTDVARAQGTQGTIYLPLVLQDHPRPTIFGVNAVGTANSSVAGMLESSRTGWVRSVNYLLWKDVEPVEGAGYNWSAPSVRLLERDMIAARQNNLKLIVIVHGTPRWASQPYQADCAPINPNHYGHFARFMAVAVARYSQAPYDVQFWEIGNEPDAPVFPEDSIFGCWGRTDDPNYYGGKDYGNMLNVVYPVIKSTNPLVKVLNGGLLLDAPPSPMTKFLSGIFAAGAGDKFDILSYHSYSWDNGTVDGTLGKTDWKVEFLRGVMAEWRVPEKPMMNTEAALLCGVACPERQADAVGRMYARAIRDGVDGYLWYIYDSDSFFNTAFVEPGNPAVPRPVYGAFKHASLTLGGAEYVGPVGGQPASVEGYHFRRGSRSIAVVWSDTPQAISLSLPSGTARSCTNREGSPVGCTISGNSVTLTATSGPTYIAGN